jgi:RNA polymerase sigma-70 factor (ECF subfamily)
MAEATVTRARILQVAQGLPAAPRIFAELERMLADPSTPLEQIAEAIKRDTSMAAQVIRLSNSAALGGEQRVGSVEEAVLRLGYREIFRMAGYIAGAQLAEKPLAFYGLEIDQLRTHMMHTAFMCEELAGDCGLDPRAAYTAGLLRPIGIFVCNQLAGLYDGLKPYHPIEDPDYLAWEGRVFGIGSNEVAALVLEEWKFPETIVRAVRQHYAVERNDAAQRLSLLVRLACGLVADEGHGLLGESRHWNAPETRREALGLNARMIKAAINRARDTLTRFQHRLASPLPPPPPPKTAPAAGAHSCDFSGPGGVVGMQHNTQVHAAIAEPAQPLDFTTFMRNYQDMVYSTAVRLIGNETQAEDIAQDVFIKAHEHFENLRSSPTAGGWLKTVATNLSINHIQRYKKRWSFFSDLVHKDDEGGEKEVEFAAPDTFFSAVDSSERREWIERALEKLPDHQRVPLVLYHFEDLPYEDIARKTGVSLSKVKTDILRGREALAKVLMRSGATHEQFKAEGAS